MNIIVVDYYGILEVAGNRAVKSANRSDLVAFNGEGNICAVVERSAFAFNLEGLVVEECERAVAFRHDYISIAGFVNFNAVAAVINIAQHSHDA